MLNIRIANASLFCAHDVDEIIQSTQDEVSYLLNDTGLDLLSANQIGTVFLKCIEAHLESAVEGMTELRE